MADLDIDPGSEDFRASRDTCSVALEGAALGPGRGTGGFDDPEFQDRMLAFAGCLREKGLEVDDPDFDEPQSPGGGRLFGEGFDPTDSEVAGAIDHCREEVGIDGPRAGRAANGGGSG